MKYVIGLCMSVLLMTACNTNDTKQQKSSPMMNGFPASSNNSEIATDDLHTAANSLDYQGTYSGTLPAASGEGIETTLILHGDSTYTLRSLYVGKDDNAFEENGRYTLEGNLLTLKSDGDDQYYRVSEGYVSKLDNDRQLITGDLEENYRLRKR